MKRMRKVLPSAESQKPSMVNRSGDPALPNEPRTATSVKGLRASGEATAMTTSTKSYASTDGDDCENVISLGAAEVHRAANRRPAAAKDRKSTRLNSSHRC